MSGSRDSAKRSGKLSRTRASSRSDSSTVTWTQRSSVDPAPRASGRRAARKPSPSAGAKRVERTERTADHLLDQEERRPCLLLRRLSPGGFPVFTFRAGPGPGAGEVPPPPPGLGAAEHLLHLVHV